MRKRCSALTARAAERRPGHLPASRFARSLPVRSLPVRIALGLAAVLATSGYAVTAAPPAADAQSPVAAADPAPRAPRAAATQAKATRPKAAAPKPAPVKAAPAKAVPAKASRAQARTATPRPAPTTPARRPAASYPAGPTSWGELNAAIARIPGYRQGGARWVVGNPYGHWATTSMGTETIYVSRSVPAGYLFSVVVHEWSHVLQARAYDGDLDAALAAMNKLYGGSGLTGAERAGDCMARALGATWTHYTTCTDPAWRAGAARLLRGNRL